MIPALRRLCIRAQCYISHTQPGSPGTASSALACVQGGDRGARQQQLTSKQAFANMNGKMANANPAASTCELRPPLPQPSEPLHHDRHCLATRIANINNEYATQNNTWATVTHVKSLIYAFRCRL